MNSKISEYAEKVGEADIVVCIPCYNNVSTIAFVIWQVSKGLEANYPDKKSVIFVSDGGSKEGTVEVSNVVQVPQELIVHVYEPYNGVAGKGSAVRAGLEFSQAVSAKSFVMVDSDLRSINPEWIKLLVSPTINGDYDQVTPYYSRYKYDGTITNFITYPMNQMLFGKRIRQPIGGDFGLSGKLVDELLASDLWDNPETSKFGIDIFMTGTCRGTGLKNAEAILGVKTHDTKDPGGDLLPMFQQVVGSLFNVMVKYEEVWMGVKASQPVYRFRGDIRYSDPEPFEVDRTLMLDTFNRIRKEKAQLMKEIFTEDVYRRIESIPDMVDTFIYESDLWVDTVYSLLCAYKNSDDEKQAELIDLFQGLWLGRVAYFTVESKDMNNREAEHLIEEQALMFEEKKKQLIELWSRK